MRHKYRLSHGVLKWGGNNHLGTEHVVEVGRAPEGPFESRMVLIGRDLDGDEVRRGWAAVKGA